MPASSVTSSLERFTRLDREGLDLASALPLHDRDIVARRNLELERCVIGDGIALDGLPLAFLIAAGSVDGPARAGAEQWVAVFRQTDDRSG